MQCMAMHGKARRVATSRQIPHSCSCPSFHSQPTTCARPECEISASMKSMMALNRCIPADLLTQAGDIHPIPLFAESQVRRFLQDGVHSATNPRSQGKFPLTDEDTESCEDTLHPCTSLFPLFRPSATVLVAPVATTCQRPFFRGNRQASHTDRHRMAAC